MIVDDITTDIHRTPEQLKAIKEWFEKAGPKLYRPNIKRPDFVEVTKNGRVMGSTIITMMHVPRR